MRCFPCLTGRFLRALTGAMLGALWLLSQASAHAVAPPDSTGVRTVGRDSSAVVQAFTILSAADGRPGKPSNLLSYFTGNRVQVDKPPVGGPALLLMGGGREVSAAFTANAYPIVNGGDIVVLRVSGTDGYQDFLYRRLVEELPADRRAALQPNSVETLIVDSAAKADSDYVANAVAKANLIWIAGGDQSAYITHWRGTALAAAVRSAYQRGAVVGGISAGMVVMGQWMYDPGAQTAVNSAEAVADPYRASIVLTSGAELFDLPLGLNLLPETHFANRDRMGRLLSFMARLRKDGRSALTYGVALDENTSLFIDKLGVGSFQRQSVAGRPEGNGYILKEDPERTTLTQVAAGLPLIYRHVQRIKLGPGQSFDFARGTSAQSAVSISVEGAVPVNLY